MLDVTVSLEVGVGVGVSYQKRAKRLEVYDGVLGWWRPRDEGRATGSLKSVGGGQAKSDLRTAHALQSHCCRV